MDRAIGSAVSSPVGSGTMGPTVWGTQPGWSLGVSFLFPLQAYVLLLGLDRGSVDFSVA